MSKSTLSSDEASSAAAAAQTPDHRRHVTETRVAEISSLLSALEEAANAAVNHAEPAIVPPRAVLAYAEPLPVNEHENNLVQVRLGLASALFAALRLRHPETASHSLRVALGCSTWALYKRLDEETRDVAELAALLHDLGVVADRDDALGAPISDVLPAEAYRRSCRGVEVLSCCCSDDRILGAVRYAGLRFDGVGGPEGVAGDRLPLEARMIAIVDEFDSLTTGDTPETTASREEALALLEEEAGTRFDPILVKQFVELMTQHQEALTSQLAGRWFNDLGKRQSEVPWQKTPALDGMESSDIGGRSLFDQQLIDAMYDGVVFVDARARIFLWSKGSERLTGVSSTAACGRQFTPSLLDMCNTMGRRVRDEACPVLRALTGGTQIRHRLEILGRHGGHVAVDLHVVPVVSSNGRLEGATVLLHDAQPEASLEEKCDALHAEVTKDPMTKVANRAEFDRMQALYIETHDQAGMPCSLIMTDIDHFKSINDTYGHQAGDEAIIAVANVLKEMCRSGDLVARYGGEEFAVLCADCTAAEAVQRAEQIRRQISETQLATLGNKRLTASFGVTQLQSGDTPEVMLGRADKALLLAKERGRNQVVQLGNGMDQQTSRKKKWWSFGGWKSQPIAEVVLTSEVPVNIAIEKLRGFVNDHRAKVASTRDNRVEIEIASDAVGVNRRKSDRPDPFRIDIELTERRETRSNNIGLAAGVYAVTEAKVAVRPKKQRNRREAEQREKARLILNSLKAYLMARETEETTSPLSGAVR